MDPYIIPFFRKDLIAGDIILWSSLKLKILSQCGFNPVTPIFAFKLRLFCRIYQLIWLFPQSIFCLFFYLLI